ncbi:uncharacterized protein [Arachis hypogaea]|uniref:uncharacterized protein n=1 Tax=Arachis hypogaea TaxID=3818 RepID=UPI003B2167DF
MEFESLEQFKQALKDFTISEGRRIIYMKNDKRRVRAACIHGGFMPGKEVQKAKAKARKAAKEKAKLEAAKEANESDKAKGVVATNEALPEGEKNGETEKHDCPWLIYCAKNSRSGGYQIKTYNPTHNYGREFGSNMADQHWVAKKLEKRLLSQPRLTHAEAWDHMKVDYNVILSDKMLYRGLRMAREKYVGNEKASNEGSSALLAVDPIPQSPPLFDKLYICLDACKRGFKAGCRPLIGLNGCFLKGFYGGQLLSAVGQDANNHFYVIVYAVVDSETKGLLPALKEVMPNAHHRNCVRHIWKNFTNKYKDTQLKNVVWACAKSSTVAKFNDNMQRLKRMNEDAWAYLAKLDPGCLTKSKFSHYPKLDNITNNMTEVWNAKIVHYRGKPILTMLEELRCYIMRGWHNTKRP